MAIDDVVDPRIADEGAVADDVFADGTGKNPAGGTVVDEDGRCRISCAAAVVAEDAIFDRRDSGRVAPRSLGADEDRAARRAVVFEKTAADETAVVPEVDGRAAVDVVGIGAVAEDAIADDGTIGIDAEDDARAAVAFDIGKGDSGNGDVFLRIDIEPAVVGPGTPASNRGVLRPVAGGDGEAVAEVAAIINPEA